MRGGAKPVIEGLAAGIETPLGRWFQDGADLSGGQWQKIALARGFMREQADMLVLDEPTAALDAEAEHAVFERFKQLSAGRTTIIISHRFPTVRMAERILVEGLASSLAVAVPLHPDREHLRGFNQSELLAVELRKRTGLRTPNGSSVPRSLQRGWVLENLCIKKFLRRLSEQ